EDICFSSELSPHWRVLGNRRPCEFFSRVASTMGDRRAMGIKQNVVQELQARQPVAPETLTEADLNELPGPTPSPQIPQRQRGLWSFLTWQFAIAPIVAAGSSLFIGSGHTLANEDQGDRAADHQKGQPDATLDHDPAAARTPGDNPGDQTDASLH